MPINNHYLSGRRRRRNGPLIVLLIFIVLLAAAACIWAAFPRGGGSPVSAGESVPASEPVSQPESALPSGEPSEESAEESAGELSSEPVSEPAQDTDASAAALPEEQPAESTAAPAGSEPNAVDESYFSDALFIGDSRTQGFILYSGLSEATAYASQGLSVDKVFTDAVVTEDGQDYTVEQALETHSGEFGKVYLMFGVNELGWNYPDIFRDRYREVVQKVKETQPNATVYVQSILPVSKEKSDSSDIYNKERIDLFNGLLLEMASEESVVYLDVASGVADADGYLPADASTDGVHLDKTYCQIWLRYLEEHTASAAAEGEGE